MQGELAVIVYNGMSRIGSSLKTDDDIRILRHHIRDLTFSLIAPVCTYDCFYHLTVPPDHIFIIWNSTLFTL